MTSLLIRLLDSKSNEVDISGAKAVARSVKDSTLLLFRKLSSPWWEVTETSIREALQAYGETKCRGVPRDVYARSRLNFLSAIGVAIARVADDGAKESEKL